MTPATPTKTTPAQSCLAAITMMIVWYAVLTPVIMIAWNVGLENAGIVGNRISWFTALGLAFAFSLLRMLLASFRRPVVVSK